MNGILSFLKELFMITEAPKASIGLSGLKDSETPVERIVRKKAQPKEIKISELMRRGSYN